MKTLRNICLFILLFTASASFGQEQQLDQEASNKLLDATVALTGDYHRFSEKKVAENAHRLRSDDQMKLVEYLVETMDNGGSSFVFFGESTYPYTVIATLKLMGPIAKGALPKLYDNLTDYHFGRASAEAILAIDPDLTLSEPLLRATFHDPADEYLVRLYGRPFLGANLSGHTIEMLYACSANVRHRFYDELKASIYHPKHDVRTAAAKNYLIHYGCRFEASGREVSCRLGSLEVIESLGVLAGDLESEDGNQVQQTLEAIKSMGPAGSHLVLKVAQSLTHQDLFVRKEAVAAIGAMGPYACHVLDDLINLIDRFPEEDSLVLDEVLNVLAMLGPLAKGALPSLRDFHEKQDPIIAGPTGQYAIKEVIKRIEGK